MTTCCQACWQVWNLPIKTCDQVEKVPVPVHGASPAVSSMVGTHTEDMASLSGTLGINLCHLHQTTSHRIGEITMQVCVGVNFRAGSARTDFSPCPLEPPLVVAQSVQP